jgi:hypothetical protein
MLRQQIKSGFKAAFFSFISAWSISLPASSASAAHTPAAAGWSVAALQEQALAKPLDQADKWLALLHVSEQKPQIQDPHFILTLNRFSPKQELLATIAYLYGPHSDQAVCRFPARYAWLRSEMSLPELPLNQCDELKEFVERAPADTISLVFASENLSQPSSMMGHLFLKVSGQNKAGQQVDHAVSFYTDATTLNLPKLFYDSMVIGKKGYFALSPYQGEVDMYVTREQRTLWEYELELSPLDRTLLQYHMQELRHTEITYFFQRYNCATLVKHILAIGAPDILKQTDWWTTPKSVVKRAQEANLIASTTVKTPARWLVRNIQTTLPATQINAVQHAVESRQAEALKAMRETGSQQGFLALKLADTYNTYLLDQHTIDRQAWQRFDREAKDITQKQYPGLELEADQSKNPVLAPRDKQVSAGWQRQAGRDHLKLGLLPVSHTLADDNAQYNSENELRLFDTAVLIDTKSGRPSLDHLTVYATQSMLPRDPLTGGISGRLRIGFEQQAAPGLEGRSAFLIEGALGMTWRPVADVDVFVLMGGGWGYRHQGYVYAAPSAGVLIREIYAMKSIVSISQISRPLGESGKSTEVSLTQSKFLDAQNTIVMEARRAMHRQQSSHQLGITLKHIF